MAEAVRFELTEDSHPRQFSRLANGWPTRNPDDHPVSELAADRVGPLSPFGTIVFPVPASQLPYIHPVTVVNR